MVTTATNSINPSATGIASLVQYLATRKNRFLKLSRQIAGYCIAEASALHTLATYQVGEASLLQYAASHQMGISIIPFTMPRAIGSVKLQQFNTS